MRNKIICINLSTAKGFYTRKNVIKKGTLLIIHEGDPARAQHLVEMTDAEARWLLGAIDRRKKIQGPAGYDLAGSLPPLPGNVKRWRRLTDDTGDRFFELLADSERSLIAEGCD
ncbi:hypothetical protein MPH_00237 [Macrophomina phaseolina MS6]|uniref:Uncharacterized protein n=1 Tax=Macrophomina phaseolina (strain MS6) TaxID=1126212 RepID=K2SC51_MACPH|nr:hypothetical protein MPH_00237 [Macrophomina phaseolina MS6]